MPNVALYPSRTTRIPILQGVVNGFPSTTHKFRATKSTVPLEDGTVISEHAISQPESLRLYGLVSDLTSKGLKGPAEALAQLRKLHQELEPLQVLTPWGAYEEMLITEITVEQQTGMTFTLVLEQVIRVNFAPAAVGDTASGPAAERQGEVNQGTVTAPEASPA